MSGIGFGFAEGRKADGSGARRALLDPRTKIALLVTMPTVLLSGAGGSHTAPLAIVFALVAAALLLSCGNIANAVFGILAVAFTQALWTLLAPLASGGAYMSLYLMHGIMVHLIPCMLMAAYAVSTTTVSEFILGMEKLHVPPLITIPLSVMFRFFPTVIEEATSVNDAMRMRDIRLGGRNVGKMVEYRLVPIMMSSLRIGEELSAASLTRGLGAPTKRTSICEIGFRAQDIVVLTICAFALVAVFAIMFGLVS